MSGKLISMEFLGEKEVVELEVEGSLYLSENGFINHNCKFCIANHLLPDGITPRAYKMSEVSGGYLSQQDRKDGKISLAGQHPHCRCSMYFVPSGYGYKQGRFTFIGLNHDEFNHQRGE